MKTTDLPEIKYGSPWHASQPETKFIFTNMITHKSEKYALKYLISLQHQSIKATLDRQTENLSIDTEP